MLHSFVLLLGLACSGGTATPEPSPGEPSEVEVAEPEPAAPSEAYLVGRTTLRKVATDDRKVADPAGGDKQVSNYVTALSRGERVELRGDDGEWTHVTVSDGSDGWLHTNRLVVFGPDNKIATLFSEGKLFSRPDLLALETDKKIEPGSLLFVLQTKDQFSEVDWPKNGTNSSHSWTLTTDLVTDANEVEAAKLIMKVRQLRTDDAAAAAQMEELARSQFASSKLLILLDQPEEVEGPIEEAPPEIPPVE